MTLPIILAIAGSVALLVGLFGGGIKAKEIEVPKISILARIFSSLVGIVLIVTAIRFPNPPQSTEQPTSTPIPATKPAPIELPIIPTLPIPTDAPTTTQTPTSIPTNTLTFTPSPSPTPVPITFEVFANQSWQSSGVYVKNGDSIQITYLTGQWRVSGNFAFSDPLGSIPGSDQVLDPECHFPMLPSVAGDQALVAKIGENGEPFNPFKRIRVGEGMLYLGINDCDKYLSDNSGSVTVRIQFIH
jgi:hypothetical protein